MAAIRYTSGMTGKPKGVASHRNMVSGAHTRARIATGEAHELKYWTQALGVTEDQAVRAVG